MYTNRFIRAGRLFLRAGTGFAIVWTLLPASSPEPAAPESLSIGYAEVDITPPLGGSMPGYFTGRASTGVLDPLLAKTLVLTCGNTTLAIVALDLIGLQAPEVSQLRKASGHTTGIPLQHIFVHSTHTHTGAETPRRFTTDDEQILPGIFPGRVDPGWVSQLAGRVASAVKDAWSNRSAEKNVRLGLGEERTVSFYRRFVMKDGTIRTNPGRGNPAIVRPAGEPDPNLQTLSFEDARILLVSYGLHPDCVGGTQYSADYPFHLTEFLRESLGSSWRVIYLNAACGNINHIDVNNPTQLRGYEESRRIGRVLGKAALEARAQAKRLVADRLGVRTQSVNCRIRRVPPEIAAQAEREVAGSLDLSKRNFNELFSPAAYVLGRTRDRYHTAEVIALKIGPLAIVGLPAETFVEIARDIKEASPFSPTLVVGLTGGAMGYMPHARGFEEGGYEAGYRSARYDPETPGLWIKTARELLASLARDR